MKKVFKVALVAICMLFVGSFANAQTKIGYLNFDAVVQLMPELKTIKTQMDVFSKPFTDQLQTLTKERQDKITAYQAKQATMTPAALQLAQQDIADLEKRMSDFQTKAQQDVEAKSNEYTKPLVDKVRGVIADVAKEKGYSYVFNTASTELLVSPPADDLSAAVKLKLGLK